MSVDVVGKGADRMIGKQFLLSVCGVAFALCAQIASGASERDADSGFGAKLAYDRSSGAYGQTPKTVTDSVSATVSYATDEWSADLILPYLRQSGPGRVIYLPGRRGIVIAGPNRTVAGEGDVTASYTRYLLNEEDHGADLDLGAIMKFGTASADKGLGSGKNDTSLQAAVGRSFGPINTTLTAGYTIVGRPQGQGFHNAFYGSLDAGYKLSDAASVGVTYNVGGTVVTGLPGTKDLTVYFGYKFSKRSSIEIYYLKGRSQQSPDSGGGISISLDF